ncbi:beta family protein [Mycobacteroides abscessus]|uniref:beta family protein n=1 Tax=Mycobacteroides abscessus TaxID=36809 RepID=UPI00078C2801|nr:beta family protein [Mycobacteroides abscessus]AMU70035.1 hypothetical protein A3O05_08260 [Mycobacteroides abscessus]MDM2014060.1 beta family protein [Mycobacteroides abscessus]MDM2021437.1 beta family protein [Mycobacteroides abscessus]MDM2023347.1 beta family protein [Mycobacteroides abscessus]MDM2031971.1 beta family protein [Mycobacteroides abscessus]
MTAFAANHYVPILFTKAGERDALSEIPDDQKSSFTPLLVVHPIDWDFDNDQPKKRIDDHLIKLPKQLTDSWGKRKAFIDAMHVDREIMSDGSHPVTWMVRTAHQTGLTLIPVVAPSRSSASIAGVRQLIKDGLTTEVCLRLEVDEWPVLPAPEPDPITVLIKELGVSRESVHLVLDLRNETARPSLFALTAGLRSLATPAEWRTLTVAATAMPQTAPDGHGVHEIPRQEWLNYQDLLLNNQFGDRKPTFGDYGIAHPDPLADIDPKVLQISAKLKYTTDDKWLLGKGGLYKGNAGRSGGGEQIRPVARAISAHDEFTPQHCAPEDWIVAASQNGPTGNPRKWLTIGTKHHVQRVLDQLSMT